MQTSLLKIIFNDDELHQGKIVDVFCGYFFFPTMKKKTCLQIKKTIKKVEIILSKTFAVHWVASMVSVHPKDIYMLEEKFLTAPSEDL